MAEEAKGQIGQVVIPEYDDSQSQMLVDQVLAIPRITNHDEARTVSAYTELAQSLIDEIDKEFEPMAKAAYELHRTITGRRNKHKEIPQKALTIGKTLIGAWHRHLAEEQRREKERLEKEAQEQAEAQRQREIEAAMDDGASNEEIEDRLAEPAPAPVVHIPKQDTGTSQSTRKKFKLEIANDSEIIKAVAAGKLPKGIIKIDLGKANKNAEWFAEICPKGFKLVEDYEVVRGRRK